MGVSRTPVREAIRKLELEGLVDMIPRKGAHVAELSVKDIMDVLEVRASLDGLATGLAAERIKDEEVKELAHILSQFITYSEKDNLQGTIKKDVEFHDLIYRASRNERLIQISSNLREQVHRFRVIYLKDYSSSKDLVKEHEGIFDAISKRNKEDAQRLAQQHIFNQEKVIVKSMNNLV
jgi:DNA-binding GntR family transcriptional regulator